MKTISEQAHEHLINSGNLKTDKNYNNLHAYVCDGIRMGREEQNRNKTRTGHEMKSIDWTELEPGETLTKFVAVDTAASDRDMTVELHGFFSERGKFYITDEIIKSRNRGDQK